jgi:tRNA(Arg) A34 adenosine deaminase TadA
MTTTDRFMRMAVDLARQNAERGGRPYACVIVKDGEVVGTGVNTVNATGDPLAHAETEAIRDAARKLKTPQLDGCTLYASGHPCAMCLAAMHVSGIRRGFYAHTMEESPAGLTLGARFYEEMRKPISQQSIALEHHPVAQDGEPLYAYWLRLSANRTS